MAGDPPSRIGSTYSRRARQLVRKGRAVWVDDFTIRLHTAPPEERLGGMDTAEPSRATWVGYFQQLVESAIRSDGFVEKAAEGIKYATATEMDQPALAVARIIEANCKMKVKALEVLGDFIVKMSAVPSDD